MEMVMARWRWRWSRLKAIYARATTLSIFWIQYNHNLSTQYVPIPISITGESDQSLRCISFLNMGTSTHHLRIAHIAGEMGRYKRMKVFRGFGKFIMTHFCILYYTVAITITMFQMPEAGKSRTYSEDGRWNTVVTALRVVKKIQKWRWPRRRRNA